MFKEFINRRNIKAILGIDLVLMAGIIVAGIYTDMTLFMTAALCGVVWLDGLFGIILWTRYSGEDENEEERDDNL
ncbi:MAG: hypothetical protein ACOCSE_00875 [Chitinivibrionales bacterium]